MAFDRLIRFVNEDDKVLYGNLDQVYHSRDIIGLEVEVLGGNLKDGFTKTSNRAKVKKVRDANSLLNVSNIH